MSLPPVQDELSPDPDLTGLKLGDYLLLRRLGQGGMAEVYLAEQQSLRRQVALKILKRSLAEDESYVKRFHHEAQAAAALVQANIVQIFEVGQQDRIHFIAQEYVQGQNLKQYMMRHGAVDLLLAVNIIRQVAAALHKAGQHGVIHRDIKPENIMLSPSGDVKVADFGLARNTAQEKPTDLTQVGITMGTPLYMSPEQIEGRPVDPRSDIYSLGVTCFHMLTGRTPFEGETALAVAVQHLKKDPPSLAAQRPDLPAALCKIIEKMLQKAPADRFQSPADLLRELRTIDINASEESWAETLKQISLGDTMTGSGMAATQRLDAIMKSEATGGSRHLVWPVALAVLLAIAGFGVGALIAYWTPPEDLLQVDSSQRRQIPQLGSVVEQYRYAYLEHSEQAWKAVQQYFPANLSAQNLLYCRRADERLGELYLRDGRLDDALEIYQRLAQVEDSEDRFQMIGLAGQAVVHARAGNDEQATDSLLQLMGKSESVVSEEMRRLNISEHLRSEVERLFAQYVPDS